MFMNMMYVVVSHLFIVGYLLILIFILLFIS